MTGTPDRTAVETRLALVDAVVYGDVFDTAVTTEELHRYARTAIDHDALLETIAADPRLDAALIRRAGLVALSDRPELLSLRAERAARADRLRARARRVAHVLRHVPFVRAIALTGSAAAGSAERGADVDLLVVVADGRLGTVFTLLGSVSRLVGRRIFCPNFYLDESHLALGESGVYVARELAQATTLTGELDALTRANPWVGELFPNIDDRAQTGRASPSVVQRVVERLLRGDLGRRLEERGRALARSRLRAHYHDRVPTFVVADLDAGRALRFHRAGFDESVPQRYATRRAQLAERLAADERSS